MPVSGPGLHAEVMPPTKVVTVVTVTHHSDEKSTDKDMQPMETSSNIKSTAINAIRKGKSSPFIFKDLETSEIETQNYS